MRQALVTGKSSTMANDLTGSFLLIETIGLVCSNVIAVGDGIISRTSIGLVVDSEVVCHNLYTYISRKF